MFVIGLTGGIGSGKSTVSAMLAELGAKVIDADQVAREVVAPGQPGLGQLVDRFGPEILCGDGSLDRQGMARRVFNDKEALAELNRIIHPLVHDHISKALAEYQKENPCGVVVLDVPLLLEGGKEPGADEVWVVAVDEEQQVSRTQERDRMSREEVLSRIAAQMPLRDKIARAHRVIDNSGTLEETRKQVENFWNAVVKR